MPTEISSHPCKSCPYRQDVPSGVWDESEYDKLIDYDNPTWKQPLRMFLCHQQDGKLCRGWIDCHGDQLLALRVGISTNMIDSDKLFEALDAGPAVPVFSSGAEAAAHGMRDIDCPSKEAIDLISRLEK